MSLRVGWIGFHMEGLSALEAVARRRHLVGVISLRLDRALGKSGGVDYAPVCEHLGVPLARVDSANSVETLALLERWEPDVVFVIGWTEIIRPPALDVPSLGMVGAHASLLPANRGRAPINWALIRGLEETGNSLMWLSEGVDEGDLVDQRSFPITPYDTCETLYARVAETNRDMILRLLERLEAGERPGWPQGGPSTELLPGRRPDDGAVDWSRDAAHVYDLIRGVTRPYPGAFSHICGHRWRIWRAAKINADVVGTEPGTVLSPVVSPDPAACGQLVACGRGWLLLLEVEDDQGRVFDGPALCEVDWTGERWCDE